MEIKDKATLRFIDKLYRDLYKSEDVLHYSKGDDTDKFGNLERYLNALEYTHNKVSLAGVGYGILKAFYYDRYVIKEENIPDSVYELEIKKRTKNGIVAPLTELEKSNLRFQIITNQKRSLDIWINYFLSANSKVYPFWLKYWAFQGMLRLGKYDRENGNFTNRTKDTTAQFIDLNEEALSLSMDLILATFRNEEIGDKDLERLVKSGSFSKIYSYIITQILEKRKDFVKKNTGKWYKYKQGSAHIPLVMSLQGYNTGWCITGEATAKEYLSNSNIYIYYTEDENGEYKVPRIALVESDVYGTGDFEITEIRGTEAKENIEFGLEDVLEAKLKELSCHEDFAKELRDLRLLDNINQKVTQELTLDELKFLYEIDELILDFGLHIDPVDALDKDPRIEKIRNKRNCLEDYKKIFEHVKTIKGDLNLFGVESADGLKLPDVKGDLTIKDLIDPKGLVFPETIGGNLSFGVLSDATNLVLPQSIGGSLHFYNLRNLYGLKLPNYIGKSLFLHSCESIYGLELPDNLKYNIILKNNVKITPENVNEFRNNKKI